MSEDESREDFVRAAQTYIATAWQGVSGLKELYQLAGFDVYERLKIETFGARAIDECEWLLEKAERANEENSMRELPKIIAAIRAIFD
jgi:hypothetical protein